MRVPHGSLDVLENTESELLWVSWFIFVLGDVLPTYYDVAISLFSIATKPEMLR